MSVTSRQFEGMIKFVQRSQGPHAPDQHKLIIQATKLARRGRYQQAQNLLASLPADKAHSPNVLDLKAKMLAQQGHFSEAEHYWQEALKHSPGNPSYRRALLCLSESGRSPSPLGSFLMLAIAIVLLMLMLVIIDVRIKQVQMLRRLDQITAQAPTLTGKPMVLPTQVVVGIPRTALSTTTQPSR